MTDFVIFDLATDEVVAVAEQSAPNTPEDDRLKESGKEVDAILEVVWPLTVSDRIDLAMLIHEAHSLALRQRKGTWVRWLSERRPLSGDQPRGMTQSSAWHYRRVGDLLSFLGAKYPSLAQLLMRNASWPELQYYAAAYATDYDSFERWCAVSQGRELIGMPVTPTAELPDQAWTSLGRRLARSFGRTADARKQPVPNGLDADEYAAAIREITEELRLRVVVAANRGELVKLAAFAELPESKLTQFAADNGHLGYHERDRVWSAVDELLTGQHRHAAKICVACGGPSGGLRMVNVADANYHGVCLNSD